MMSSTNARAGSPEAWRVELGLLTALAASMVASLLLGLNAYAPATAVEALLHYDPSRNSHVVLLDSRLPRALIGPAVGAALAASGLLVQSVIRSPIVSPTVLGINAGSGFAVVAATFAFGTLPSAVLQGFSLLGALTTGAVVLLFSFLLQSARRDTSILLLGAAVASLFQALTQTLLTVSEATLQEVLYWLAGSVQGRSLDSLTLAAPLIAVSLGIGFVASPHLDLLRLGERSARTLGQRVILIQSAALTAAAMLAGAAVFAAGPVGFVGLVVPHLVRRIRPGPHWRQLIVAVLLGGTAVTLADLMARYVVYPNEVPVGVITASLGVPALIRIVVLGRRNDAAAL